MNVLNPEVLKIPWTREELTRFKGMVESHLEQTSSGRIPWSRISQQFPGRTDAMCREAWTSMKRCGSSTQAQWEAAGHCRVLFLRSNCLLTMRCARCSRCMTQTSSDNFAISSKGHFEERGLCSKKVHIGTQMICHFIGLFTGC